MTTRLLTSIITQLLTFMFIQVSANTNYINRLSTSKNVRTQSKKYTPRKSKLQQKNNKNRPSKQTNIQAERGNFEGTLLYRTYNYCNNIGKMLSLGSSYNGVGTFRVTVKGNNIHIENQSLHHNIIITDAGKVYYYNDVSRQGLVGGKDLLKYFAGSGDMSEHEKDGSIEWHKSVKNGENSVTYKGDLCKVYKVLVHGNGIEKDNVSAETTIEYWYSDKEKITKNIAYAYGGHFPGGIMRKGIVNERIAIPIFGNYKMTIAYELVAISRYSVSSLEFLPPENINIVDFHENKQMLSYLKTSKKALKNAKLEPEKMSRKNAKHAITEQWDFANEWIERELELGDYSWDAISEKLFANISRLEEKRAEKERRNLEKLGRETLPEVEIDGVEMLKIPYLINNLSEDKDKIMKMKISKSELTEYDKAIEMLRARMRRGETHIAKTEWEKYKNQWSRRMDNKSRNRRTAAEINSRRTKDITNTFTSSDYSYCENQLIQMETSWSNYKSLGGIEEVRRVQNKMRKLRQKYQKIVKSKWEDWNGVCGQEP